MVTYAEHESFASLSSSAGWPEIVAFFPLTRPIVLPDANSLLGSQSCPSVRRSLFADGLMYLPTSIFSTAGSLLPALFQNVSSGLSHRDRKSTRLNSSHA